MLIIKSLLKNKPKFILAFIFFVVIFCVYYFFDPEKYSFFLKCPLKTITGYECAGCGVQRSLHAILHFHFLKAFKFNALFVVSILFFLFFFLMRYFRIIKKTDFFYSKKFLLIALILILLFSLLKNTSVYKGYIDNL